MLIFLIGFMGCGKSYTGRNLAPLLQYDYIDMDVAIEEQVGKKVKEIFEQNGEDYFRQLEHNYLLQLQPNENKIIATGGGVPCFFNNMEIMNQKGITIYLNRDKEVILARLKKGMHKRPLLQHLSEDELAQFYDFKLAERNPYYEQAKIHVGNKDFKEIKTLIDSFSN